jgi:hypothetical protein
MEDDFEQGSSAIQKLTDSIFALINANKTAEQAALDRANSDKEAAERKKKEKEIDDKSKASKKELIEATKKAGSELLKIGEAGIKFASTIGTSATRGIELEFRNRASVVAQILKLDADRAVSLAQQQAAQQALTDSFISTREGFELSAKGTQAFAANLKGGFKSEFQLTNESLRALVTTGMATEAQFENFRKASGRASLSSGQFASVVNKNTLSFLLYGPKFAKAAVDAERLGISLSSLQAAQEGLVTNLDGTIDTVAQLNQLGAQVDFGTLVRVAEQEGPDALMAYARATIPANLLQSTSTRALFKQLGISAEDFLKAGGQQKSAAESIEEQMTEAAKKTNSFGATLIAIGTRAFSLLTTTFGGVAIAGFAAAKALFAVAASGGNIFGAGGALSTMGGAARFGLGAAGLGIGIGGIMAGRSLVEQGNTAAGIGVGALGGGAAAALLALALAPATAGGSLLAYGAGGAALGAIIAGSAKPANDMVSAGYGSRMLVTPNGAFALNNADDIIAGTNLFPKGSLNAGSDNSELVRKVDNLITALSNATTTINVGGGMQTVPRMQLVGVYSRNEVR